MVDGLIAMTYVITTRCVGTKDHSCVDVCPVDAIHPSPEEPDFARAEQLYIDPLECIDCDACLDQCPVEAIFPERELPAEHADAAALNARFFAG
jgi:ferredoxin